MLSTASASSLTCAATVFFKVKVMLPLRTMGSIKGWLGSCRRSGDNRRQPQQWFHRVCFGGSSGARSPSVLHTSPGRLPDGAGQSQHLSKEGLARLVKCFAAQAHTLLQPDVFPGPALHADMRYQSAAGFMPPVSPRCGCQVKQQSHKLGACSVR